MYASAYVCKLTDMQCLNAGFKRYCSYLLCASACMAESSYLITASIMSVATLWELVGFDKAACFVHVKQVYHIHVHVKGIKPL